MFPQTSRTEAQAQSWDMILAGSSFAAMFFLRGLPKGLRVLVVEKGPHLPHEDQIARRFQNAETIPQTNHSDHPKDWVAHTALGGNSNCWWACTPRFHPNDFRLKSFYDVGEDWPLSYAELEPFYEEVEAAMEINGGGSDAYLPRRTPFPYPAHLPSRTDKLFRTHDPSWFAQPTARANGGSRAGCCANGVCELCPVDAKYSILNAAEDFAYPGARLLMETEVRRVEITGGRVTGVTVRDAQGEAVIGTDNVGLGTNALFNAVILMRSGVDHDRLGRGLNEQAALYVLLDGEGLGYWGGTSITGHGYALYDGAHRAAHSGVLLEVHNAPVHLRMEPGHWTHRARLKLVAEDLPRPDNRVVLEGDSYRVLWHGHDDYALRGLDWGVERLPDILPDGVTLAEVEPLVSTEKHMMGTHPFGTDPTAHVVDPDLRVHGVNGLWALGAGVYPTTSPANPTLTLAALSLRAGRAVT